MTWIFHGLDPESLQSRDYRGVRFHSFFLLPSYLGHNTGTNDPSKGAVRDYRKTSLQFNPSIVLVLKIAAALSRRRASLSPPRSLHLPPLGHFHCSLPARSLQRPTCSPPSVSPIVSSARPPGCLCHSSIRPFCPSANVYFSLALFRWPTCHPCPQTVHPPDSFCQ